MWLYHKGEFVGSGLTGEQRQNVHGYAVTPEEIVLQLECVTELHDHPRYGSPLEDGSFSTWPRVDVEFDKSEIHGFCKDFPQHIFVFNRFLVWLYSSLKRYIYVSQQRCTVGTQTKKSQ